MQRFALIALLVFAVPTHAGEAEDMSQVVDTHMVLEEVPQRLDALYAKTVESLAPVINDLGGTIIDKDAFQEALLGAFDEETIASMRELIASHYEDILAPDEIATLAEFYRSPEGVEWVERLVEDDALTDNTAEVLNGPLAPLKDHWQGMQVRVSEMRSQNEARLNDLLDLRRIAEIMAMDHIVAFETAEHRQKVLDGIEDYLTN